MSFVKEMMKLPGLYAQCLPELFEKRSIGGGRFFTSGCGQLFEQLFLVGGEVRWCPDYDSHKLISLAHAVKMPDTFITKQKDLPGLGSGRNLQPGIAIKRGNVDLGPQRRVRE